MRSFLNLKPRLSRILMMLFELMEVPKITHVFPYRGLLYRELYFFFVLIINNFRKVIIKH